LAGEVDESISELGRCYKTFYVHNLLMFVIS